MSHLLYRYSEFVASRAKPMTNATEDLLHAAIGVSGEGGELLDAIKKSWVYNQPIEGKIDNIIEELGDALFYIQMAANYLGISLEHLIDSNMQKLTKRYPTGYSDQAAKERADKAGEAGG